MPSSKGDSMRGLEVFISDIRNCKSKEAEVRRINKELANIRSNFKGDKSLDGYQKKKYVCKLLFIFLLGHDVDFGYNEAVNLLCSNHYTEKQIGYLFISVLIDESHPLVNLVILRLKDDLCSRNPVFVNLALQCIANIGGRAMAENFAEKIPKLLFSGDTIDSIKQSAALCLLKLIRVSPELISYDEWTSRVIHLLNDQHLGVVTAAVSLIDELAKRNPEQYKGCMSLAVSRLSRIITSSYTDLQDYTYYFVPAPWVAVKLLRLLQNFPPPDDNNVSTRLYECLDTILRKVQEPPKSKKVQHSNAKNAVLFEAINLIIHMDCDAKLLVRACHQLGQFLQHKETNLRYLALESLCLLATSEHSHEAVKKHQETIVNALKVERDISVRQRAVDLLYAMCDRSNAQNIVSEMLGFLELADYSIREEMVLKVAILAEKYATDYSWYVDTILSLIRVAGDYVSDEVWNRVIQIVVNRDEVQGYAAKTVFEALQAPACHENMLKVGGYILGEFGNLIAGDPRSAPMVQFNLLHSKYHLCSPTTRQQLLSTFMKFINLFPEIKPAIRSVFMNDTNLRSSNVEIQQRVVEYLALSEIASPDVLATVLEEMPPFPERQSSILAKLKAKNPNSDSVNVRKSEPNGDGPINNMANNILDGQQSNYGKGEADTNHVDRSADIDLLGLGMMNSPAGVNTKSSLLLDLGDHGSNATTNLSHLNGEELCINRKSFINCLTAHTGVIFENEIIQIGVRVESRAHLCRIGVFYGNKSRCAFTSFSVKITCADANDTDELGKAISIEMQQFPDRIEANAQVQQTLNIECLRPFTEPVILNVAFLYEDTKQNYHLLLPFTLNKLLQPANMNQTSFFTRWQSLSAPEQECQKIHAAQFSMDLTKLRTTLTHFGITVLDAIDPNPNNLVGAGIVATSSHQFGVLLRVEPNQQSQMYRVTIRSTKDTISKQLVSLLTQIL